MAAMGAGALNLAPSPGNNLMVMPNPANQTSNIPQLRGLNGNQGRTQKLEF